METTKEILTEIENYQIKNKFRKKIKNYEVINNEIKKVLITKLLSKIKIPNFNNNTERDIYYRDICNLIQIPTFNNLKINYLDIWKQYTKLESLPQPEQKSPEWFEMRNNFITASAGAQALEENKYDKKINLVKQKIGIAEPFKENRHVHHGKKFEKIAILIYEHINNVKVGEFGLVPHISEPRISFLGASPDGICTCTTLDNKFSNLVGRMLEIKCTTTRKINTYGDEDGEICPHYYWVQVQLQLECCDLEECDFWQCKLVDYTDKEEWQDIIQEIDTSKTNTIEQDININVDEKFKYGCIIEFIPKNKIIPSDEKIEWYGQYIYPTNLDMTLNEKVKWAEDMAKDWKLYYPELEEEYKFNKIMYWHLEKSHCYLIKRNREWYSSKLDKLKDFWDLVIYYRNNDQARLELQNKKEEKKIYVKKTILPDLDNIDLFASDSD